MNPYDILGVRVGASDREIHEAYRALAQIYHPDRFREASPAVRTQAEKRMRDLNAARDHLLAGNRNSAARASSRPNPQPNGAANQRTSPQGQRPSSSPPPSAQQTSPKKPVNPRTPQVVLGIGSGLLVAGTGWIVGVGKYSVIAGFIVFLLSPIRRRATSGRSVDAH